MMYQDLWIKGESVKKGARECESRFNAIAQILEKIPGPLRVLDFGGHTGYFSFRIAERFSNSNVVFTSLWDVDEVQRIVDLNSNPRVHLILGYQTPGTLQKIIKDYRINVALALSVLHNNRDNWQELLKTLSQVKHLFVETIDKDERKTLNADLAGEIKHELKRRKLIAQTPAWPGQNNLRPLYYINKHAKNGVFCSFDFQTGIKTYNTPEYRDKAFLAQSMAAKEGLAPPVYEKIGGLGFRTGIADTSFFEKYFPPGVYCHSVFREMHDKILKIKRQVYGPKAVADLHSKNLGIYEDRVVSVDFSP